MEAEVISILTKLKCATAPKIWKELVKQGKRTAYTTVLTVLSRLYARGFVNKREDVVNGIKQNVYELTLTDELKYEIVKEHLDLIVKMFGEEGVKYVKEYLRKNGWL